MSAGDTNILTWPHRMSQGRIRVHATVLGDPISKQRPRFVKYASGKVYTPKHTKEAEQNIAWTIKSSHRQIVEDGDSMFGVRIIFHCKNHQRRDIDNMCKLVFDACNGFVWKDDVQVGELHSQVFRDCSGEPRTEILIYLIGVNARPERICAVCRKMYQTYPSWSKRKYCSRACASVALRSGTNVDCSNCGKRVYLPMFKVKRSKRYYCSRECFSLGNSVEKTCAECGTLFRRPISTMKGSGKRSYCSEKCMQDFYRKSRAKNAYGVCPKCGGPMSKKNYKQCRSCAVASGLFRSPGHKVGWSTKQLSLLR